MNTEKKVKVWNRSSGSIFYKIDSLRITRDWPKSGDVLEIPLSELKELQYTPGGMKLMEKYMLIKDQDVCRELGLPEDPEYFYDEKDILELLNNGTEDQLLDCLEFAPYGVLTLLKDIAVKTNLDSSQKRKAISKRLNVDIDSMIKNNNLSTNLVEEDVEVQQKRRSAPINKPKTETAKDRPTYVRTNK